ncbi:MAG: outer membrane protein assembly factor BamE [Steroidobacteraceae bacterium]
MVQRHRTAPVFRPRLPSLTLLAALLATLLTSGCVYRMTVQQGNFLDARQVVQVKEGMTRAQIRFLLGTPMLPDAFDRDRWDYLYYLQVGRQKEAEEQRLTIYFTDDKVSRIENVGAPTEIPAEQASTPASTPDSNDAQS